MKPLGDPFTADQDEVLLLVLVVSNLLLVCLLLIYLLLGLLALRLSASSERPAPAALPLAPVLEQSLEGPDESTLAALAGLSAGQDQLTARQVEVSAAGRGYPRLVQPVRREVSLALRPDYHQGLSTSLPPPVPGGESP